MTIHLLVPGPFAAISGGYIYDRRMVEGLRALGETVEVVELPGTHPAPDDAASEGARAALAALPADARIVIDGLGLPAFLPLAQELQARRAVALIHHPTALEHGAPDSVRTVLKAKERALFGACARLVCTSALTARRLPEEFGADPARIGVVEPGTDPAPSREAHHHQAAVGSVAVGDAGFLRHREFRHRRQRNLCARRAS
ncbi:MAG: hypothetical protein ACK4PG_14930, partial [Acetobacteraceae bacterium]